MYGVPNTGLKRVTSVENERYRLASEQSRRLLGWPSKKADPDVLYKVHLKTKTRRDRATLQELSNRQKVGEEKVVASRNLLQTLHTTAQRFVRSTKSKTGSGGGSHVAGSAMESQTLKKPRLLSKKHDPELERLQKLFGKPHANFPRKEQKDADHSYCESQTDLLIVVPTRCGKSLASTLPAFLAPGSVVIIIVLLVALQTDFFQRYAQMGLEAVRVADCDQIEERKVLVSAKDVSKEK